MVALALLSSCPVTHTRLLPAPFLCALAPFPPQLLDGNKYLLTALGSGLWPVMVLLSEVVQTFILADFW